MLMEIVLVINFDLLYVVVLMIDSFENVLQMWLESC